MKPQNPSEKVAAAIYRRILTAANSHGIDLGRGRGIGL
jgi:hypothetical protein